MLQSNQQLTQQSYNAILFARSNESRCDAAVVVYAAPTHLMLAVKSVTPIMMPPTPTLWGLEGKIGGSPLTAIRSQVPVKNRGTGRSPTV